MSEKVWEIEVRSYTNDSDYGWCECCNEHVDDIGNHEVWDHTCNCDSCEKEGYCECCSEDLAGYEKEDHRTSRKTWYRYWYFNDIRAKTEEEAKQQALERSESWEEEPSDSDYVDECEDRVDAIVASSRVLSLEEILDPAY